jgi:F-type H+-transporting ATPase subunit b
MILGLNMGALAYAQEAAEATSAPAAEAATTMPQFEISTFAGQIFWLLTLGMLLYLLLAKIALPQVQKTIADRDKLVFDTLQKAAKLRDKAEGLKIDYDRTFRHADEKAKDLINSTADSIAKNQAAAIAKTQADMLAQVQTAEANLQAQTTKMLAEIDSHAEELAKLVVKKIA